MSLPESPERWRRVEAVFTAALDREPAAREAFLAMACDGDDALRTEVESLLAAHERTGILERMAEQIAPLTAGFSRDPQLEGCTVGPYAVKKRVGGGGMGVVHEAYDQRLDRTVALKFLQAQFGMDSVAADRFRLEARTVAALEHPNICTVHEIGETDDGLLYLAMPLYDGETVQQRINRGPLSLELAVTIAIQVLRGLAKAHARGIIHRDVKPSNVFITSDDVVKLLDFGIAKLADVTLTGTAAGPIGTLAYMSPEQALGAPLDARTDIWSVGVMLYEMLCGQRPYASGAAAAMGAGALRPVPVSLRSLRPEISPALEQAVMKALERDVAHRYQSAAEFERALAALGIVTLSSDVTGAKRGAVTESNGRGGPLRLLAAAALVGLATVGAWFAFDKPKAITAIASRPAATSTAIAVLPFTDRTTEAGRDFFGDGITEELIATLSRVEGLRVASATSVFAYKNKQEDVRAIGERLGVGTVLEGSVRQSGNRLRIVARLVNVTDGLQLWTEQYERPVGDAFSIQSEIASAIAQVLQGKLMGIGQVATIGYRPKPEAYEIYLQAAALQSRIQLDQSGAKAETRTRRLALLNEAVRIDPKFAAAWNSLATAWASDGFGDAAPPNEVFPKAEAFAKRALEADSTYAEALNTLAYVQLYYNWNLPVALESFRRAVQIRPGYRLAHQWYANALLVARRFDEAAREMQRAQALDSSSLVVIAAEAWVYHYQRDFPKARMTYQRALRRNPDYIWALLWGAWTYDVMDSLPQAVRDLRRLAAISNGANQNVIALARMLARNGERDEARSLLAGLLAVEARGQYLPSYELAKVHLALDERDAAFARLEKALVQREHSMMLLSLDPQFDAIRADPRFASLLDRIERARR